MQKVGCVDHTTGKMEELKVKEQELHEYSMCGECPGMREEWG